MNIYLEILCSVLRYAFGYLAMHLVDHHIITSGQADRFALKSATDITLAIAMAAPVVWSAVSRYRDHVRRDGSWF